METFADSIGLAFPWVTLIVMLFGLFGLIVPIFPGGVVIWGAALLYGWIEGFNWWFFGLITVLMLISTVVDNILMGAKAKDAGGSFGGILAAFGTAAVISFFFTPLVGILSAPAALFGFEVVRQKDAGKAWEVTKALAAGWGWSFVARFILGAIKIVLFVLWAF